MTSFLLYLLLIFPLIAVIVAHSASVVTVLVAVERILKKKEIQSFSEKFE